MADEKATDGAQAVAAVEVSQEVKPEEAKPKADPKQRTPHDQITSTLQRQVSDANRKTRDAERRAGEAESRLASADSMLKMRSDLPEEDEARLRHLVELETTLTKREHRNLENARTLTVQLLTQTYGIPEEEISDIKDPVEMENAALRWQVEQLRKGDGTGSDEEEPEKEAAKPRPKYDGGSGTTSAKRISDMTGEEFAAYSKKIEADSRRKQMRA